MKKITVSIIISPFVLVHILLSVGPFIFVFLIEVFGLEYLAAKMPEALFLFLGGMVNFLIYIPLWQLGIINENTLVFGCVLTTILDYAYLSKKG